MSASAAPSVPRIGLATGTLLVMAAEALAFPAGLVAAVLLTRHFAPDEYGALALALAGIAWLEWTVVSLLSRAAWKLVAEAEEWRVAAEAVVRAFALASLPFTVLIIAGAGAASTLLGIPAPLLRVLALEIPLFVIAQAYRAILVGRGLHGSRAAVAALRWTVRAALIAAGVAAGAPLAWIGALIVAATGVELGIARWRVRRHARSTTRGLSRRHGVGSGHSSGDAQDGSHVGGPSMRRLLAYAGPLALSAVAMRLFDRIDIFALRLLGGSLESVANYGVAQNLALAPGLLGTAFTPALIAALSGHVARGDIESARRLSGAALRLGVLALPMTLLVAGSAPALIELLFGPVYADAALPFALLVTGAVGTLMMAITGGVLAAAGRLHWTVALSVPVLVVALCCHLVAVPRAGAVGAAAVTAGTALAGAAAGCIAVRLLLEAPFPAATLVRGLIAGTAAGAAMHVWPVRGLLLLPALAVMAVLLAAALALGGELRAHERAAILRWTRARSRPARTEAGR